MVKRRYRKARGRRSRRRYSRRGRRATKALRMARSISRKMAAEVKKLDCNDIIPENSFQNLTAAAGTAADAATSLPDYGYLYNVFDSPGSVQSGSGQGINLGDFVGEQVRAKYLYLGVHLQMPTRPQATAVEGLQQPVCLRCMVVQDRNFSQRLTFEQMTTNLFGLGGSTSQQAMSYLYNADFTLLPINPQEPGRFNVMRDFKMYVAPGYRMDYYKKLMFLQRDLLSGGRLYAGNSNQASTSAPGLGTSDWSYMRNCIYVLFYFQSPTLYSTSAAVTPDFTISVQTRLAYYDN